MPMIDLTLAKHSLDEAATARLVDELLAALLRWEGAPDNELSRSLAWAFVNVADHIVVASSPSGLPHYRVAVTTPEGALDDHRRAGLVAEVTALVLAAEGSANTPDNAFRVWVHVHEIRDGNWGAEGRIWRFADIISFVLNNEAASR